MATMRWLAVVLAGMLAVGVLGRGGGRRQGGLSPTRRRWSRATASSPSTSTPGCEAARQCLLLPDSLSTALAMTYAGARGETATQMAGTLRFPMPGTGCIGASPGHRDVNGAGAKAGPSCSSPTPSGARGLATSPPSRRPSRITTGRASHRRFRGRRAGAETINAWVEEQTRDKIKDLIPEGVLTPDTRLVLTNAIYFKGKWKHAFPEAATRNDEFTLSTGKATVTCPS